MAAANYPESLRRILVHEGGYVNDPDDPGGPTMRGVTQRVYDGFRKRNGKPAQSVMKIEAPELEAIYRVQYANKIRFDELPRGVDYAVLDGAVNSGPAQAVKWLQRALRMNLIDGSLGDATLAAVSAHPDHDKLIADMLDRRMAFLRALKTWRKFGDGWTKRVNSVRRAAQAMASGSVPAPVERIDSSGRKARIEEAKPRPATGPADVATGTGAATGTIGGAINEAKDALAPAAGDSSVIGTIVVVLVIAGVLLTVGGILWRLWQKRKAAEHADALDVPQAVAT